MKGLTFTESEEWLLSFGARVDENRNLRFSVEHPKIMTTMPKNASRLAYFSARLVQWLSGNGDRLFWISNWETYPAEPLIQFETMRLGCGESRHLIDAPGHLFLGSNERDDALLSGLVFLVMAFNWQAYLVRREGDDFLYLGDEFVVFSHSDGEKISEIKALVSVFGLETIEKIEEAWK